MNQYKRIGDYIQLVDERNRDLQDLPLMGLSITKKFIPSIANTIGTDMSTYKIVKRNQFAFSGVTSRNGNKITIALFQDYEKALVSQAYTPFEIIDNSKLLSEYLMMWFRRPEFDRYARFKSHGSAREIFDWGELCDTLIPVPSIDQQREIVKEYNVVQDRIALNNKLIQKLEETAQAIYKQWFVDFEFPNENGKPYKSSRGKMVWNEVFEKEVPNEWERVNLSSIINIKDGTHDSPSPTAIGFPLVSSTHLNLYDISLDETYNISKDDFIQTNKRSKVDKYDILFSMIGTVGLVNYVLYDEVKFAIKNVGLFKTSEKKEIAEYILFYLKSNYMNLYLASNPNGSTQNYVTLGFLRNMPIILPSENILLKFKIISSQIIEGIHLKVKENNLLSNTKIILLSKLATIKNYAYEQ